jgi:hypothetical protein
MTSPRRNTGGFYLQHLHLHLLVGICLAFANQYPPIHVPQVPDVPDVPKDVPHVPEVPEVPMVSEFVWQTYYKCQTIYFDLLQENFFNKILTNKLVYVI